MRYVLLVVCLAVVSFGTYEFITNMAQAENLPSEAAGATTAPLQKLQVQAPTQKPVPKQVQAPTKKPVQKTTQKVAKPTQKKPVKEAWRAPRAERRAARTRPRDTRWRLNR
jgi:hypothetical protein